MKQHIPLTIDDLEATAKDDKFGIASYRCLKVYWDDAINKFYYYKYTTPCTKEQIIEYIERYGY